MKVGIRVDANDIVATGHVMRCLAIADGLRNLGVSILFISANNFSRSLIIRNGYDFLALETNWKYMDGEVEKLQGIIKEYKIGVLIVDSYYVSNLYLRNIHNIVKTVYIDDLGKDIYDVDAVICYANYYEDFALNVKYSSDVKLFQGMSYTPLRSAFSNLPKKEIGLDVEELIVLSGGTDAYNFLWNFSKKIFKSYLLNKLKKIHIICGKYYNKFEQLAQEFAGVEQFYFHKAVDDIEKYMLSADVAISASGMTIYELCAVGVPSIIYTIADNQLRNAESFWKDGLMDYVGDLRYDYIFDKIIELLQGKYQDLAYRKNISEAMRKKEDGKGVQRISKEICKMLCII